MRSRRALALLFGFLVLPLAGCGSSGGGGSEGKERPGSVGTGEPDGVVVFDGGAASGDELLEFSFGEASVAPVGEGIAGVGARFSPDGSRLAYARRSSSDGQRAEAFVLDLATGEERSVGPGACPTWSLDGRSLVISLEDGLHRMALDGDAELLDPDPAVCGIEVRDEQYVLWRQEEVLELLGEDGSQTLVEAPGCGIGPVDVDSSGLRIAYTVACDGEDPQSGVWVRDLDSTEALQLIVGRAYGASWSPNDEWLATSVGAEQDDGSVRYDLWVADVRGGDDRRVAEGQAGQPTWGPGEPSPATAPADREVIVYEEGVGSTDIRELDLVTGESTVLLAGLPAHTPAVTPDGEMLAWAGPNPDDETWPAVYVRDLEGGEPTLVGSGASPAWTLDGKGLVVSRPDGAYRLALDGTATRIAGSAPMSGLELAPREYLLLGDRLELHADGDIAILFEAPGCEPFGADVSSDGAHIVFGVQCEDPSGRGIQVYDLEDGSREELIAGDFWGVSWSPDASAVVAARAEEDADWPTELWTIDVATGDHEVLTTANPAVSWPSWMSFPADG